MREVLACGGCFEGYRRGLRFCGCTECGFFLVDGVWSGGKVRDWKTYSSVCEV